jgi:hypothetical protein
LKIPEILDVFSKKLLKNLNSSFQKLLKSPKNSQKFLENLKFFKIPEIPEFLKLLILF